MAKPYFSEREVRLARSFIKAIGGNALNGYLLLAVIAWQRAMTKGHETFWKSLSKYTAVRAGQLLAARLKSRASLDRKHFVGVLAALQRHGKSSGYVDQARDFMLALEQSEWNKGHYGYKAAKDGYWQTKKVWDFEEKVWLTVHVWVAAVPEYDPLAIAWAKLTGHNIPKAYFNDTTTIMPKQPKPKPDPPRQPRSLMHVMPEPDYLQPYAARTFYEERPHLGANVLPE